MKLIKKSILTLASMPLFAGSAYALEPAPMELRNLIGDHANSANSALRARGYVFHDSETREGSNNIISTWWNAQNTTCINVLSVDNQIYTITTADNSECDKEEDALLAIDPSSHIDTKKIGSATGDKWYDEYIGTYVSSTEAEFERRGYANVDDAQEDHYTISWWWQWENNRCFKVISAYGRVDNIRADRGACDRYATLLGDDGGAVLYRGINYTGSLQEAEGNIPSMRNTRIGNDSLSSVRLSAGCSVELFEYDGYRGESVTLEASEPDLGDTEVGDNRVSSVTVTCE